ncbi:MAG: alpha/beta fold hydrolase [Chloroflexota bacterium]|nr:carboxylesterase family protein [Chloroflexota bacterium]
MSKLQPQNLPLTHLVRPPRKEVDLPPLLILLHGLGSNQHDLFGTSRLLDERFLILSPCGPYALGGDSFAWYEVEFNPTGKSINPSQIEESRKLLIQFIQEAVTTYGADPQQVYLMGFSQGAIMSANVALTRPDLVTGLVLMSGRILPKLLTIKHEPEELAGLSFLVIHGTEDTVLPIEDGRAIRELLSELPVNLTYSEYEMGHEVSRASLTEVVRWLSARLDELEP